MRLIDADALLEYVHNLYDDDAIICVVDSMGVAWEDRRFENIIDAQPTIESVLVIKTDMEQKNA